ncbi:MAG: hypothetical protein J6X02_05420 [Bacilli bacterium]|nr:hypothetical protein [Bacilli bacterium]
MKYHVDFDNFEEYKVELQKMINSFNNELDILFKSREKLIWQGEAYDTAMDIFCDKMKDLYVIPEILELYIKFIDTALSNYQEGMEEIRKSFEEILERIKEEKRKRGEIVYDE